VYFVLCGIKELYDGLSNALYVELLATLQIEVNAFLLVKAVYCDSRGLYELNDAVSVLSEFGVGLSLYLVYVDRVANSFHLSKGHNCRYKCIQLGLGTHSLRVAI